MNAANPFAGLESSSSGGAGQYAYFDFQNVNQFTDNDGLWVEQRAADEFTADICRPDGMELDRAAHCVSKSTSFKTRRLWSFPVESSTRPRKNRSRRSRSSRASGSVPRTSFKSRQLRSTGPRAFRPSSQTTRASPGTRVKAIRPAMVPIASAGTRGEVAHLIRIEADGYQPAVSRGQEQRGSCRNRLRARESQGHCREGRVSSQPGRSRRQGRAPGRGFPDHHQKRRN